MLMHVAPLAAASSTSEAQSTPPDSGICLKK